MKTKNIKLQLLCQSIKIQTKTTLAQQGFDERYKNKIFQTWKHIILVLFHMKQTALNYTMTKLKKSEQFLILK